MNKYNIIGFAGGTASGKTTLSSRLFNYYGENKSIIINQDSYYKDQNILSNKQRKMINYDHPDSIDIKLLSNNLNALINGKAINNPFYNYTTHKRDVNFETVYPKKLIIIEGTLVFHFKQLTDLMLLKIFIHSSNKMRFKRRIERDVIERGRTSYSVRKQYVDTVYPMHQKFIEPTRSLADIEISGEKNIKTTTEEIISIINSIINKEN